jgi:hypothetical protein
MTKDKIIEAINELQDSKDCSAIAKAATERGKQLRAAEYQQQVDAYWKRAIFYRAGQTLYCNAPGTFLGGPMQRGDKCKVQDMDIDRKDPLIWIVIGKRSYGMPPHEAYRYRLLPTRPEQPISKTERELANTVGKLIR